MTVLAYFLGTIGFLSVYSLFKKECVDPKIGAQFFSVFSYALIFSFIEALLIVFTLWGVKQNVIHESSRYAIGVFFLPLTAQIWVYQWLKEKIDFGLLALSIELLLVFQAILVFISGDGVGSMFVSPIYAFINEIPRAVLGVIFLYLLSSLFISKIFERVIDKENT